MGQRVGADKPAAHFVQIKNVGRSGCLLQLARPFSNRPPTRRSNKGGPTDKTGRR